MGRAVVGAVWAAWWGAALAVAVSGCGAATVSDEGEGDAPAVLAEVTWQRDLRPVVETSCVSCHKPGGIGPIDLTDDPEAWQDGPPAWAPAVAASVASGSMPPFDASSDCHPLDPNPSLPEDVRARFTAWAEAGYPAGDPADYVAPAAAPTVDLGVADVVAVMPEAYTPSRATPDDYRCFLLDGLPTGEQLVRGLSVTPGSSRLVHHAIVYLVFPGHDAELAAQDAAQPGPGWSCYGGPLAGSDAFQDDDSANLFTWVPGSEPEALPDDTVRVIPDGGRLVLQVHYNVLSYGADEAIDSDQTSLSLWLHDGPPPVWQVRTQALGVFDLRIPPGDPAVEASASFPVFGLSEVIGVMPHMHQLGSKTSVTLEHADGTESCVVDVPEYDFDWQRTYLFPRDQLVTGLPGDRIRLSCTYDNSAENQPVFNGEQLEPRTVTWGEGTLDEMCLAFLHLREPFASSGACGPWDGCFDSCGSDGDCLVTCLVRGAAETCTRCKLLGLLDCGARTCLTQGAAFLGCSNTTCGGDLLRCAVGACATQAGAWGDCMAGAVAEGTCDAELDACDP